MSSKFYRFSIIVLIVMLLLNFKNRAFAQFNEYEKPLPELSAGIKAVAGEFEYGPRHLETTSPFTSGFQPSIRFDLPFRLFTIKENPFYLSLTASTGFLYIPTKKQSYHFIDPYTGQTTDYQTSSPFYIPFYFGFYSLGSFGVGMEAFYAKGLNGISDLWGAKVIGLSYNHSKFRINGAYEVAVPVNFNPDNPSYFISIDFLWKLKTKSEY